MGASPERGILEKPPAPAQDDNNGVAAVVQTVLHVLSSLRPSFLTRGPSRAARMRKTAYLDGIRGFAAFIVYWVHHQLWAHEAMFSERRMESSFGYKGEYFFCTLPIVRTFFTGSHLSVGLFFILSGYVLSCKPLQLLYAGDFHGSMENLGASLFKRWFRLYLPIIFVTFFLVSFYHWTGVLTGFVPERTWTGEIFKWYNELKTYTFIYGSPKTPWFSYHPHTWTIPVELRGSVLVFLMILATARSTRRARLWCLGGMMFYCMYIVDGAFYCLFLTGLLLCDLDLHEGDQYYPKWLTDLKPYENTLSHIGLVFGLWIGGVPSYISEEDYFRENPGWYWLAKLKPKAVYDFKWFYIFWGAVSIVLAIQRIGWLKRFFETRFCQYLGKVSYMLYLVHGPVLWSLGDRIYAAVGHGRTTHTLTLPQWINRFPLPKWGPFGMEFNFLLPHIILLPLTFWLADVGTSLVDTPSLKFGAWLYRSTLPARHENRR